MTTPTGVDPASQLQGLIDLVVNPNQTQEQANAGQLSFVQVREQLLLMKQALEGKQVPGTQDLTYEQLQAWIRDNAPKVVQQQTTLDALNARVLNTEQQLEPMLKRANDQLIALTAQAEDIKQRVETAFAGQNTRHDELIGHAKDKFEELQTTQNSVVEAAKTRFDEMQVLQSKFEAQVATKVIEIDQKMSEVTRV